MPSYRLRTSRHGSLGHGVVRHAGVHGWDMVEQWDMPASSYMVMISTNALMGHLGHKGKVYGSAVSDGRVTWTWFNKLWGNGTYAHR